MSFKIVFTKQAEKDLAKVAASTLKKKALHLLQTVHENPFQPPYEKLVDQAATYSRRINIQHRLVYRVDVDAQTVVIIRMWTHYGDN
ncbi:MAG: Txe/YoeB family addiction module toxin [Clostridia bacterium]|nr:Txe/YoeB family addiction module toxin [Clostridia bacterium]